MMLPMQEQLSNSVDSKCTVLGSQVATGNSTCSPVQSMSLRLALENEWILKGEVEVTSMVPKALLFEGIGKNTHFKLIQKVC